MAFLKRFVFILIASFALQSCISSWNPASIVATDKARSAVTAYTEDQEAVAGLVLKSAGNELQLQVNLPGAFQLKYDLFDYDGIILFSGEEWTASGSIVHLSIKPQELEHGTYLLRTVARSRTSFHTVIVQ